MKAQLVLALVSVALLPVGASGQSAGTIEFGTDLVLGLARSDDTPTVTSLSLPASTFRVGFHVSDELAIEPRLAATLTWTDGHSSTRLQLGGALMYSVAESVYLFGEGGFTRVSFDASQNSDSASQGYFGGGLGLRRSLDERLGLRWEFGATVFPETDDFRGRTVLGASMGVSFFTHGS